MNEYIYIYIYIHIYIYLSYNEQNIMDYKTKALIKMFIRIKKETYTVVQD